MFIVSFVFGYKFSFSIWGLDPLVVLPSIYLIDLQGTPLEVIGGLVDVPSLVGRAKSALDLLHKGQNASEQKKVFIILVDTVVISIISNGLLNHISLEELLLLQVNLNKVWLQRQHQ